MQRRECLNFVSFFYFCVCIGCWTSAQTPVALERKKKLHSARRRSCEGWNHCTQHKTKNCSLCPALTLSLFIQPHASSCFLLLAKHRHTRLFLLSENVPVSLNSVDKSREAVEERFTFVSFFFFCLCVLVCACRTAATAETNLTPDMYYDAEGQLDEPRVKEHAGATRISKEEDF